MSQGNSPAGLDGSQATLVTSTSVPATATAVTLVTSAALGCDRIFGDFRYFSSREYAVSFFALVVSIFATWVSSLPTLWKILLTPLNFCLLTYLCFASLYLFSATPNESANAPATSTYVIHSTSIPAN